MRYSNSYFVINVNKTDSRLPVFNNIAVSLPNHFDLRDRILEHIKSAQKCLKICSFIVNDKEVYEALYTKIVDEKVPVFILTSLSEDALKSTYLTDEERSYTSKNNHFQYIKSLYNQGAHIRAAGNIHAKFIISDSYKAILMSSNLTEYSLNLNPESGVLITNSISIDALEHLFELIYLKGTTYKSFSSKKSYTYVESTNIKVSESSFSKIDRADLLFTFDKYDCSLYEKIVDVVSNANKFIRIATYSVVGLNNLPELITALKAAVNRGVNIIFFCRAMNHRSDHLASCTVLHDLGIPFYADFYNHSKGISTENDCLIFTANIDGIHGLKSGFEVGKVLQGKERLEFISFLEYQIQSAPLKFMKSPKSDTYLQYENYKESVKKIKPPSVVFKDILNVKLNNDNTFSILQKHPLYLIFNRRAVIGIRIGSDTFECIYENGVFDILSQRIIRGAEYYLRFNRLKRIL